MPRIVAAIACVLLLTGVGCVGGDRSAGDRTALDAAGSTRGAPVAPSLAASRSATGIVEFCTGDDFSGAYERAIARFNARYRDQHLTARLVEFPSATDEQRRQAILRLDARSPDCDVYQADPTWIAEFARQRWLMDISGYVRDRAQEFIGATLAPFRYDGRYWGVPQFTGVGLLYRRTDVIPTAPVTWQEAYLAASAHDGLVYQGAAYEGLTVNFLELAYAAGGRVLSDDGRRAVIDSPANLEALRFMVDGIERGAAPRAVTTYLEEPTRFAFEAGRATLMRNPKCATGSPFRHCPPSTAGGAPASWAGTARCSPRTPTTRAGPCCSSTTSPRRVPSRRTWPCTSSRRRSAGPTRPPRYSARSRSQTRCGGRSSRHSRARSARSIPRSRRQSTRTSTPH
jgi:ABC-type glycerol-3-phosphate transport system substrate-binding protein